MSALSIGLSGILTSQRLLDITGQNIANANNPAYHRQVAHLAARMTGNPLGAGVYITSVRRDRSALLESAVIRNAIEEQSVTTQFNSLRQIEVFLAPGDGGVDGLIERFFNQLQELAAKPGDVAQRRVVLNTAAALTDKLNSAADELRRVSEDLDARAREAVSNINTYSKEIADLNSQIERATLLGQQPNDLLDQRDDLVKKLAQLIDVQVVDVDFNQVNIIAAGAPIVVGTEHLDLAFSVNTSDQAIITPASEPSLALNVTGGQMAGLLQVRNGDLADVRSRLDTLSQSLVTSLDQLHATGLGLQGPLSSLTGYRGVSDPAAALSAADLAFPPQAGDLYVSVTNTATGTRTLHRLTINPATQSLNDLAAAISSIPNLTATVDPASNTLQIVAASGYAFDFAGRLPSPPENIAITGTSTPQVTGSYTGSVNDTYTFTVVGSGTVGVTPGLTLQVRDGGGNLLGSFNIGEGYDVGSALPDVNGVAAKLSAGTVNDGDSFQTRVVANADTANLLTALGLNTFFTGDSAGTLAVRPDLLSNPEQLNASRSGDFGDGTNLLRMVRLRDQRTLAGGTQNFREFYAAIVGDVGVRVRDLGQQQEAQQVIGERLEAERQAASGVDPNEELINMLQFQRSFQMAARYVAVINETLDSLLLLIG